MVLRTTDIAQLFNRCLLEPFDAKLVEVRDHREHSNMDLLQTIDKCIALKLCTNSDTVLRRRPGFRPTPDFRAHGQRHSCQPGLW